MSGGRKLLIPAEGCHWYLPDGTPFYTVPYAASSKKKGERNATLTDAKKVGAAPSVTTITKIIEKQQLNNYHEEKVFKSTLGIEPKPGEDTNALFARVKAMSRARGKAASKRGDSMHASLENYIWFGVPLEKRWQTHCENVMTAMVLVGFDPEQARAEHSFYHKLGFGGKIDYHEETKVADFKSKDRIEKDKQYAYREHEMQLAAYRQGLGLVQAECWNFFVGELDAQVLPIKHEEATLHTAWMMFHHLLAYWQLDHDYFPGEI